MATIYPVIMSGGSGTRMWPLSRKATPKQYLPLIDEETLFQKTVLRCAEAPDGVEVAPPTIICAATHADQIDAQFAALGLPSGDLLLEPMGRNTAVVAAMAAAHIAAQDPDGLILLLPADHHIPDITGFWASVTDGAAAATDGKLVTLGIQPTGPETGYGYIRRGDLLDGRCFTVDTFVEKPDLETAKAYLADGAYFWNAGIFLFSAKGMAHELGQHAADIKASGEEAYAKAERKGHHVYLDREIFAACRDESIDYAVMEPTEASAIVAPVDIGWNDIGSWSALSELKRAESGGVWHQGDVLSTGCTNTYIRSEGPTVAAIGLDNVVIVATGDSVLVMPADKAQDVKKIINELKASDRKELL